MVYIVYSREMSIYGTSRSPIKCLFKVFVNVVFPLIDLKQIGKLFQIVQPENIKVYWNRLFLGLGKESL